MIKETKHFILDTIHLKTSEKICNLKIEDGLEIFIKYHMSYEKIAKICYNCETKDCEIVTYKTNFQDCIISWELFKEFIELVDEAYTQIIIARKRSGMDVNN